MIVESSPTNRNHLPGDDGLPALLIPSAPVRGDEAMGLLRRGVLGIVAPGRIDTALLPALTLAATGHLTVDPAAAAALIAAPPNPAAALPQITTREEDILRSIAAGDTVRQTARVLRRPHANVVALAGWAR